MAGDDDQRNPLGVISNKSLSREEQLARWKEEKRKRELQSKPTHTTKSTEEHHGPLRRPIAHKISSSNISASSYSNRPKSIAKGNNTRVPLNNTHNEVTKPSPPSHTQLSFLSTEPEADLKNRTTDESSLSPESEEDSLAFRRDAQRPATQQMSAPSISRISTTESVKNIYPMDECTSESLSSASTPPNNTNEHRPPAVDTSNHSLLTNTSDSGNTKQTPSPLSVAHQQDIHHTPLQRKSYRNHISDPSSHAIFHLEDPVAVSSSFVSHECIDVTHDDISTGPSLSPTEQQGPSGAPSDTPQPITTKHVHFSAPDTPTPATSTQHMLGDDWISKVSPFAEDDDELTDALPEYSPRPLKRTKRRSMAMGELLDTGLAQCIQEYDIQEPVDFGDLEMELGTSPTQKRTAPSRACMVSSSVQTDNADWIAILESIPEHSELYACSSDCTPPCVCCVMRRVAGTKMDPLAFAILKAKKNADECSQLRFLNEVQIQEMSQLKRAKAEDVKNWKHLFDETEETQQQLVRRLRDETKRREELEDAIKELRLEKEELECEVASLRLQVDFRRNGLLDE